MPERFRRVFRLLAATTLLVALPAFVMVLPASSTSESSCTTLKQWARQYRGRSITLNELATLDRKHRIAVFNALTPTVRAGLWRDQLRRFDGRTDLTETQHALIQEASSLAVPVLYEYRVKENAQVNEFWKRAQGAFSSPEHLRIWFDLGAAVAPKPPVRSPSWTRVLTAFNVQAQDNFCQCNNNYGWLECPSSGFCMFDGCAEWVGCGPIGNRVCNGVCAS